MRRIKIIALLIYLSPFLVYSSDHFSISLWLHSSMFPNDKKTVINELNEKLMFYKDIGITNLYVFKTLKSEHKKGWDFLKYILKTAHNKGLKVHPVVTSGHRVRMEGKIKKHPEWLIKDPFGKTLPYLNISNPEVRKYIKKRVKKLLKYDIDGIHLDYIRFPYLSSKVQGDSAISIMIRMIRIALNNYIPDNIYNVTADNYFSYDERTLTRFEEYYKGKFEIRTSKSPSPLGSGAGGEGPAGNSGVGSAEHVLNEWRKWNASNVTLLVKNIHELIKRSGEKIPLSVAIISNREFAFHSLGQDWKTWGKEKIVDIFCPMIYSNDNSWFKERLKGVLETVKGKCKVFSGIAIVSSTNKNTPKGVSSQIRISKEMGADGIVIFSGQSLTQEFGQVIKGISKK